MPCVLRSCPPQRRGALLETAAVRPAEQIGFIDPSRPGSGATTVTPAPRSPACDTQRRQVATRTAPAQAAIWAPAPGKARGRPVAVQVFGWRSGAASTSSSAAATVLRQALRGRGCPDTDRPRRSACRMTASEVAVPPRTGARNTSRITCGFVRRPAWSTPPSGRAAQFVRQASSRDRADWGAIP